MKNTTIQKFADKSAKIGIVGLGYVGLPLPPPHAAPSKTYPTN